MGEAPRRAELVALPDDLALGKMDGSWGEQAFLQDSASLR